MTGAIRAPAWLDDAPPGGHTTVVGLAEEVAWLVAHRQGSVAARASTGLTRLQLSALPFIGGQAPVIRTDLLLGTRPLATSAMVDRLIRTGLVCSADPQNRRRVQLTSPPAPNRSSATST